MRKIKIIIPILILFISIGFAAISFTLSLNGDIEITGNLDNFNVYFSRVAINGVENNYVVKSKVELNFSNVLDKVGTTYTVDYDITNASNLFDANITLTCTPSNEYLSIVNVFDSTTNLPALETRSGKLTLKKNKSVASSESIFEDISCSFVATPVERESSVEGEVPPSVSIPTVTLKATTYDDTTAFRSETYKKNIKNITFEDKIDIPEDAIESWDISDNGKGGVMAYVIANQDDSSYYDLYIQSDLQLYANPDMSYWFAGFYDVDSINNLELLNTSNTTNMKSMFSRFGGECPTADCVSSLAILDLSTFDTSNVTDMSNMFEFTGSNNSSEFLLNISNFDTGNVTDMSSMFYSVGDRNLNVSNFDTSKVTDMSNMFSFVYVENLDLSSFDTSKVTDMSSMFEDSSISEINLDNFDTGNVTDMSSMFAFLDSEALNLSDFDTSNVTDMSRMFYEYSCIGQCIIDLNNFDTSNVTDMIGMFGGANIDGFADGWYLEFKIDNFDTSKVTDMSGMFYYAQITTSIVIMNPNVSYNSIFDNAAMILENEEVNEIRVGYTNETFDLVNSLIENKSESSNIVLGYNMDSLISFSIEGNTYQAYENMTWDEWISSSFNTDKMIGMYYVNYDYGDYVVYYGSAYDGTNVVFNSCMAQYSDYIIRDNITYFPNTSDC